MGAGGRVEYAAASKAGRQSPSRQASRQASESARQGMNECTEWIEGILCVSWYDRVSLCDKATYVCVCVCRCPFSSTTLRYDHPSSSSISLFSQSPTIPRSSRPLTSYTQHTSSSNHPTLSLSNRRGLGASTRTHTHAHTHTRGSRLARPRCALCTRQAQHKPCPPRV